MKMNRTFFEKQIKKYPDYKLYSIGKNKYLHIKSFKYWLKCLIKVLRGIVAIPIGFIWGELEFLGECITELPEWFIEMCKAICDILPIQYIKVTDESNVIKAKFKNKEKGND